MVPVVGLELQVLNGVGSVETMVGTAWESVVWCNWWCFHLVVCDGEQPVPWRFWTSARILFSIILPITSPKKLGALLWRINPYKPIFSIHLYWVGVPNPAYFQMLLTLVLTYMFRLHLQEAETCFFLTLASLFTAIPKRLQAPTDFLLTRGFHDTFHCRLTTPEDHLMRADYGKEVGWRLPIW